MIVTNHNSLPEKTTFNLMKLTIIKLKLSIINKISKSLKYFNINFKY